MERQWTEPKPERNKVGVADCLTYYYYYEVEIGRAISRVVVHVDYSIATYLSADPTLFVGPNHWEKAKAYIERLWEQRDTEKAKKLERSLMEAAGRKQQQE